MADFQEIRDLKKYPSIVPLMEGNVYAYRMFFSIINGLSSDLVNLVNIEFESNYRVEDFNNIIIPSGSKAIALNVYSDFGGYVVRLVTNSKTLISEIRGLKLVPPPPWVSFPDIDPDGLGGMQGDLSFWWDWMWLPFWNGMDKIQKNKYLVQNFAPENWVAYFDFYENHINKNNQ